MHLTVKKSGIHSYCISWSKVEAGDIIGYVQETKVVQHKIMVPYGVKGKLVKVEAGNFKIEDTVYQVETESGVRDFNLIQRWPVRRGRPYKVKKTLKFQC